MNKQQAVLQVLFAVREAVIAAGPSGLPAGTIYAQLMTQGCTLQQYEQIESLLLSTNTVRKRGDLLLAIE